MDKTIYTKAYSNLVSRLKKARDQVSLNQEQAGRKLGRSQSYISKIESGQLRLDIIQLKEIARVYKKSLDFFIK
jgi:transcriptional regulator with XRE-family HTH domain